MRKREVSWGFCAWFRRAEGEASGFFRPGRGGFGVHVVLFGYSVGFSLFPCSCDAPCVECGSESDPVCPDCGAYGEVDDTGGEGRRLIN